jgi:polyisoprenoid-binding protein YceI
MLLVPPVLPLLKLSLLPIWIAMDVRDPAAADKGDVRRFVAENRVSKNQLIFSLETRTEKVTGLSNEPQWVLWCDPANIANTLKGELSVSVKSLDTGKREHNQKLQNADWLDAAKHPEIRFELRAVKDTKPIAAGDWNLTCEGVATVRGKEHPVELKFRLTYRAESAETRERAPGDLVVLRGSFELPQSVFGSAGEEDRTITLDLRLFGSTEPATGKPGAPASRRRTPTSNQKTGG